MNIVAAISSADGYYEVLNDAAYPSVLISFHYDRDCVFLDRLRYRPDFVLSDSGAFTAWQLGTTIDLDDYLRWCDAYRAKSGPPIVHINLDVIPGAKGKTPSPEDRARAMTASLVNADRMRHKGLPIMEVYHQFEPLSFLDQLLERRRPGDLLGISPRNDLAHAKRRRFLDGVWHHVLAKYGSSDVPPLHGLGVSDREFLHRYPWRSADSLSWVMPGIFGRVMTRTGASQRDERTYAPEVRYHECMKYLATWRKWNAEIDALWARRGIQWQA